MSHKQVLVKHIRSLGNGLTIASILPGPIRAATLHADVTAN